MLAIESTFTVIDFETTGIVDSLPSLPWQIGLVFFSGGTVDAERMYTSLLNVGDRPFNPYAPGRHAQLRGEIAAARSLADLWPVLRGWLSGRWLVAHNVATERKCLGEAFPMHVFGPWVDTLSLSRIAYPDAPSHQLGDLLEMLSLKNKVDSLCPGREAHDALYDACASAVLLEHFLALPEWEKVTVQNLLDARPARHRKQRK